MCLSHLAAVEGLQVEAVHRLGTPQYQGVDSVVLEPWDWGIVRECEDSGGVDPRERQGFGAGHVSTEPDHALLAWVREI